MILWLVRKLLAWKARATKWADLYGLIHCPECGTLLFVAATDCNEEHVTCDQCKRVWRVANNANDVYIHDWPDQLYLKQ